MTETVVTRFTFAAGQLAAYKDQVDVPLHPDDTLQAAVIAGPGQGIHDMAAGFARLDEGQRHPRHVHHAGAEFCYFLGGSGRVILGDQKLESSAGTAIVIPAMTPHAVEVVEGPVDWLWATSRARQSEMGLSYHVDGSTASERSLPQVIQFDFSPSLFETLGDDTDIPLDPRDGGQAVTLAGAAHGITDMSAGAARMSGEQTHLLHHHPTGEQFYYFVAGRARVVLGTQEFEAAEGTAFPIPAGVPHSVRVLEEPVDWLWAQSSAAYSEMGLVYDE